MTEPIREPSPDARAALQAIKAEHALEPNRHRHVMRGIERSIEAGDADPGGRVDALLEDPGQRAPISAWTWAVAAAAAVAIAIWGIRAISSNAVEQDPRSNPGVAPYQADDEKAGGEAEAVRPEPVPRSVPAPVAESVSEPEPETVHRSGPASAGTSGPEPESVSESVVRRPEPKAEPKPKTTGLSDEMALMRRAQASLDGGDPAGALRALRKHAQRHGHGQLVEDRLALQIIALCELGNLERARKKAAAFGREFPSSHYRQRIASCLEKSSTPGDGSD